ncbi:unnamed protein product [Arctogadus glacialis]
MQHPLAGGACVALPGGDAPQLSCAALTFMYLQQRVQTHAVLNAALMRASVLLMPAFLFACLGIRNLGL